MKLLILPKLQLGVMSCLIRRRTVSTVFIFVDGWETVKTVERDLRRLDPQAKARGE